MNTELSPDFELIFEFKNKKVYKASFLFEKLIKNSETLENAEIFEKLEYSRKLKVEGEIIELSIFPLICYFKNLGAKTVYSIEHINMIVNKLKYENPIYSKENSDDFFPLSKLKWDIFLE